MDPKILTEGGWKAVVLKFKVKDNGVQKALAIYENLAEDKHADRLKALATVSQLAGILKKVKEVAVFTPVVKYLSDVVSTADAQRKWIETAMAAAAKAATDAKKPGAPLKQDGTDDEAESGDYPAKLLAAYQKLKGAKGLTFEFIICDAKPHLAAMMAKKISPKHKEELTKVTGGSKRFLPIGNCHVADGKIHFNMEKPASGLARRLQESIKHFTGKKIPIMVGTESAEDEGLAVPDDDHLGVALQKPLGVIAWERHRATLWAMTDPAGAIARGGGKRQQADLAKMNEFGDQVATAVAQMNALEGEWRQSVEVVRKAAAQSATDIKKVEAELPVMRERRRKDENFFRDVDGYLSAMENAEGIIDDIRKAEAGLKKAASMLQSDELWKKANDKENEVKDDEQAVAAKEAEIKEAKRITGAILDIVEKVVKQDWSALASQALEFARDKASDASVEAQFGRDLADLKAKLAAAQSELKNLKIEALSKAVEASRFGVSEALIGLDNAKKAFGRALGQLARLRTKASDTLKKSKSTAAVGVMFAQRAKQLHAIDVARSACERYGRISGAARNQMTLIANKYGTVGSWLNGAAAADPTFDRSKPYAKTLERSALSNAVELGRWDDWVNGEQGKCRESLSWLADTGAKGPMVHFERAFAVAKEALVDR